MRYLDPTRHQETVLKMDSHVPTATLRDRVNSRWMGLTILPAFVLHAVGRLQAQPRGYLLETHHHAHFGAWSLILLFGVPALVIVTIALTHGAHRAFSAWRARRKVSRVSATVDGVGLVQTAHATLGIVRVRGELHRAANHDPFDARPPVFFVHDATGTAKVDDDHLLLVELEGSLPPDGTLVEVAGPGHPSAGGFVFDGSVKTPIAIRRAGA